MLAIYLIVIISLIPEWEFAKLDQKIILVTQYLDWQSFSIFKVNSRMAEKAHLKLCYKAMCKYFHKYTCYICKQE